MDLNTRRSSFQKSELGRLLGTKQIQKFRAKSDSGMKLREDLQRTRIEESFAKMVKKAWGKN